MHPCQLNPLSKTYWHRLLACRYIILTIALSFLSISSTAQAKQSKTKQYLYEDNEIRFKVIRRAPKQLSAFYEGRGFSKSAIDLLKKTCGLAIIVSNRSNKIMWLELKHWRFISTQSKKEIERIKRDIWKKHWQRIKLPQAHQSTFGWTLMPESRDLRVAEGVGGNITIPFTNNPFTIEALFYMGKNKQQGIKKVQITNAQCLKDVDVE